MEFQHLKNYSDFHDLTRLARGEGGSKISKLGWCHLWMFSFMDDPSCISHHNFKTTQFGKLETTQSLKFIVKWKNNYINLKETGLWHNDLCLSTSCRYIGLYNCIFSEKRCETKSKVCCINPRTTEVHGRMTHWEFLKIRNEQKYQNIILITFQHLKKLYWFWKLWGCSSQDMPATPFSTLNFKWV